MRRSELAVGDYVTVESGSAVVITGLDDPKYASIDRASAVAKGEHSRHPWGAVLYRLIEKRPDDRERFEAEVERWRERYALEAAAEALSDAELQAAWEATDAEYVAAREAVRRAEAAEREVNRRLRPLESERRARGIR